MPRPRNPNRDRAYELWVQSAGSRSLKSIAEELGESQESVRKWKCKDKWDKQDEKKRNATKQKKDTRKGNVTKRHRGGQPGNKNADGGPPGNTKALKHGAYSTVLLGLLDEDEQAAMTDADTGADPEAELCQTLGEINARIVRLTKFIDRLKSQIREDEDLRTTTTHEDCDGESKVSYSRTMKMKCDAIEGLTKLETELDKAHGRKIKVLEALEKLRMERKKLEYKREEARGDDADALVEAIVAAYDEERIQEEGNEDPSA